MMYKQQEIEVLENLDVIEEEGWGRMWNIFQKSVNPIQMGYGWASQRSTDGTGGHNHRCKRDCPQTNYSGSAQIADITSPEEL